MEQCTVETGLLRKTACGQAAVTHCANCEQPLCIKHAVPELTEAGKKSGKFMCKECHDAKREYQKTLAAMEKNAPPGAAAAKTAPPKAPAAPAAKPGAPAPKPADDGGAIEFTPSKDKK